MVANVCKIEIPWFTEYSPNQNDLHGLGKFLKQTIELSKNKIPFFRNVDKIFYTKAMKECIKRAKQLSWLNFHGLVGTKSSKVINFESLGKPVPRNDWEF